MVTSLHAKMVTSVYAKMLTNIVLAKMLKILVQAKSLTRRVHVELVISHKSECCLAHTERVTCCVYAKVTSMDAKMGVKMTIYD